MWDLSSPTRDQTCTPRMERQNFMHGPSGKALGVLALSTLSSLCPCFIPVTEISLLYRLSLGRTTDLSGHIVSFPASRALHRNHALNKVKWCYQVMSNSFATPWTVSHQAPLSMEFSRQEYRSGLPSPYPGDLPNPGLNPGLPHCRQILYYLSHQGSPLPYLNNAKFPSA